jgi:threonine dehydratase
VSTHAAAYRDAFRAGRPMEAPVTALQQRERWAGRTVGVAVTGGDVDAAVYARVLTSVP